MEQTQSLKQLILDVDDRKIFLPEFQRDFVWEISKTYDLFDSLVKDIFIGAIIYGIPSFDIAMREIDNRRKITKGKKRTALEVKTITKKGIEDMGKFSATHHNGKRQTREPTNSCNDKSCMTINNFQIKRTNGDQ